MTENTFLSSYSTKNSWKNYILSFFSADDCSGSPASGSGIGTECDTLVTDGTCTQMCTTGYSDNNGGNGQEYTCVGGTWAGTALVCTGVIFF